MVGIGRHGGRSGRGRRGPPPSARGAGLVPLVLAQLSRRLAAALEAQHALHGRLLLRFLASLSAAGVVPPATVLAQLQELVNAGRALLASAGAAASLDGSKEDASTARAATGARRRGEFLLYAVLAALPWFVNPRASTLATVGGGSADADVRRAFGALVEAARAGVAEAEALAPPRVTSVTALHPDRAAALDSWLDAPEERQAGAGEYSALARSQLTVLLEAVTSLLDAEASNLLDDEEEDLMADEGGAGRRARRGSVDSADSDGSGRRRARRRSRSREGSYDAAGAAEEEGRLAGSKRRRSASRSPGSDDGGRRRRRSRGGRSTAARPSIYCVLAVPTIARPGDLDATATALLGGSGGGSGSSGAPLERPSRLPDAEAGASEGRDLEGPSDHGPVDEAGRSLDLRAMAASGAAGVAEDDEATPSSSAAAVATNEDGPGAAFLPPAYTPVTLAVTPSTGAVAVGYSSTCSWTRDRVTGGVAASWAPLPSAVPLTPSAPPPGVPQSGVLGRCSGLGTAWAWPSASASFIRPNVALFGRGGLSSSAALLKALKLDSPASATTPLALWAVREVAHDVLVTFAPFHAEAAETLMALPMGEALGYSPLHRGGRGGGRDPAAMYGPISSTPLAVEALLSQLLWVPASPLSQTYVSTVLLDMLAQEAQGAGSGSRGAGLVGASLGMASRVLWKYLPLLDEAATDRVLDWMAQHVASTKWQWLWAEWKGLTASAGRHDPSLRFLRALLARVFALLGPSHYEEVVKDVFPPEWTQEAAAAAIAAGSPPPPVVLPPHPTTGVGASPFLPSATSSRYAAPEALPVPPAADPNAALEAPSAAALALGQGIAARIADKAPAEALAAWLAVEAERAPLFLAEVLEAEPGRAAAQAPLRVLILAHAVLSHAFRWAYKEESYGVVAARYQGLLVTSTAADDVGAHLMLLAVDQVLGGARNGAAAWAVEDLVRAGILTPSQVVAYQLTPVAGASLLTAGTPPPLSPSFLVERALDRHRLEAVEAAVAFAEALSHRAGVELSLWRGARVYDDQEVQLDLAAGAAKEEELLAAAKAANAALAEAVLTAVARTGAVAAALASVAASLASSGGSEADEDVAAAKEAARAALSRLRALARRFAYVLVQHGQDAVHAAVDAACAKLVDAADEAGSPLGAVAPSALAAVHATLGAASSGTYVPQVWVAVPPLLRDMDAPAPVQVGL